MRDFLAPLNYKFVIKNSGDFPGLVASEIQKIRSGKNERTVLFSFPLGHKGGSDKAIYGAPRFPTTGTPRGVSKSRYPVAGPEHRVVSRLPASLPRTDTTAVMTMGRERGDGGPNKKAPKANH